MYLLFHSHLFIYYHKYILYQSTLLSFFYCHSLLSFFYCHSSLYRHFLLNINNGPTRYSTSLMMFIVVLPEVIINTWGVNKGALVDGSLSVLSLGNLGEVNGTIMVPSRSRGVSATACIRTEYDKDQGWGVTELM